MKALSGTGLAVVSFVLIFPCGRVHGQVTGASSVPNVTPEVEYGQFSAALAKVTGVPEPVLPARTYDEAIDALRRGAACIASLTPLNYVLARDRDANLELMARLELDHRQNYGSVLIARSDVALDSSTLRNAKFAYFSERSASGYLYPLAILKQHGFDIAHMKQNLFKVGEDHVDVIEAVLKGEAKANVIAGTWTGGLEAARAKGIDVRQLRLFWPGEDEIPQDAIVLNRGNPRCLEKRAAYRKALRQMLLPVEGESLPFPAVSRITGIILASEEDYDGIREVYSTVAGTGTLRVGLSLDLDPRVAFEKLQAFRPLKDSLFKNDKLFLDLRIYAKDRSEDIIESLSRNTLDLGELRPIPAGKAMSLGLKALLMPTYLGQKRYTAFLIQPKGPVINYPSDVVGKKIAVLDPNSASSYAYPIDELTRVRGIAIDATQLQTHIDEASIVKAVANGTADLGAIAEFKLVRMRNSESGKDYLPEARQVQPIDRSNVEIPQGAYVLNRRLSQDRARTDELERLFRNAGDAMRGDLTLDSHPAEDDEQRMINVYKSISPSSRSPLPFVIGGSLIAVLSAVVLLLRLYTPAGGSAAAPTIPATAPGAESGR